MGYPQCIPGHYTVCITHYCCMTYTVYSIVVRQYVTISTGACPALCLLGGRGLTWVTWRRGAPWVGRVDRPSHEAERERGAAGRGTDSEGEELGSSPRPWRRNRWRDGGVKRNVLYNNYDNFSLGQSIPSIHHTDLIRGVEPNPVLTGRKEGNTLDRPPGRNIGTCTLRHTWGAVLTVRKGLAQSLPFVR